MGFFVIMASYSIGQIQFFLFIIWRITCNISNQQFMALQASRLTINSQNHQIETTPFELPELGDNQVRVQVLFSAISRNDVLLVEGKHTSDYFGPAAVGKVVAVGKSAGRKIGESVGVYHRSINRGQFKSGFSNYLQVDSNEVVFLPTIPLEQASSLLSDGIVAFNALERIPKGSNIAVVGTGSLAYITVQFAKKVFGLHVTVLSLGASEGVAESFGADAADVYSIPNTKKYEEKFDAVVVAEPIDGEELAKALQNIAMRTGKLYFLTQFNFHPNIAFMDFIVCQREMIGVKRGDIAQYVKLLHAAAYGSIQGRVEVLPAGEFQAGFVKAKESNFARQVVLQY